MTFQTVEKSTSRIEEMRQLFLGSCAKKLRKGTPLYLSDFLIASIVDRTLSNIHGFLTLSIERNFLCSASILRMQIDTAMRANAFNLVDEPNTLAKQIMRGERFSSFEDRDGKKMKDWYLRKKLSESYLWVQEVYDQTSSMVHLSSRHIFAAISAVDDDESSADIAFSLTGLSDQPLADFGELYEAFDASLRMTYSVSIGRWENA